MRVFKDWKEAYPEILRDLKERGVRVHSHSVQSKDVDDDPSYTTHEITGYNYQLLDSSLVGFHYTHRPLELPQEGYIDTAWAIAEVEQRLKPGINPGSAYALGWLETLKYWAQWAGPGGKFDYTYSERMGDMFEKVCDELAIHPFSRQVIVPVYRKEDSDSWGGARRIPCSMYYQFLIRDKQLHMIYTMRSCDAYQHLPSDVFMALKYRDQVARDPRVYQHLDQVSNHIGHFHHFIGSLHVFQKDVQHVF